METKHTPGPWKVRRPLNPNDAALFLEVLAVANGIYKPYVAEVRSLDAQGEDNSAANARLIAAAPTLLTALESILQWADPYALPDCERNAQDVETARAAIARAKRVA